MSSEIALQLITAILCFISIFFAIFLWVVKSKNVLANRILALFLIVRAVDASVLIYGNYLELHPALDVLRHDAGGFFQAPLLFLFVLSIIYKDFSLKSKHLLLLVPFLLSTLVALPRYYLPHIGIKIPIFNGLPSLTEVYFSYSLFIVQNLGLVILTFFILSWYKRIIFENYSITDNYNHRWLFQLNVISALLFVAALIKNIHKFQDNPVYLQEFRILVMFISLVFICWLVFKALLAPKLFRGIDSNLQLVNSKKTEEVEKVEDPLILRDIEKLKLHMVRKEPFLNPQLTIAGLAVELGMNVTDLSILINRHLSQNFHTFINRYRIEKAKELLKSTDQNYTIQEILYKVGFNSKSSFNVSFKEFTGLTPTQYKRQSPKNQSFTKN